MGCEPQGAASPGSVVAIWVPNLAPAERTAYMDASFAHELLHAIGVRHHGGGDYDVYWKVEGDAVLEFHSDGGKPRTLTGSGVPITIVKADGTDITAKYVERNRATGGTDGLVGVERGESSGDDTCVMRYDRNSAYVPSGRPGVRVLIQTDVNPEPVGSAICRSGTGTGINAASPGPSRYGDAQTGRGNCWDKMKISDQ